MNETRRKRITALTTMTGTGNRSSRPVSHRSSPAEMLRTAAGWASAAGSSSKGRLVRWFRRLRIRWEIRHDIHEAFPCLVCAVICLMKHDIIQL
jgi:hypothetical protein